MMTILALSSLVSLLTLTIQLWQPRNNDKHHIPTAYLGAETGVVSPKPRFYRVPPFIWLATVAATLCLLFLYAPRHPAEPPHTGTLPRVLWVDNSLSATWAFRCQRAKTKAKVLEQLATLWSSSEPLGPVFLLRDAFLPQGLAPKDDKTQPTLLPISSPENAWQIIASLWEESPSPATTPFDFNAVSQALGKRGMRTEDTAFIALTDGQRATVAPLVAALVDSFARFDLWTIPFASHPLPTPQRLVPQSLKASWQGLSVPADDANDIWEPWEPGQGAAPLIPPEALPNLFGFFDVHDSAVKDQKNLFFTASLKNSNQELALKTALLCDMPGITGPWEINAMADLLAVLRRWQVKWESVAPCSEGAASQATPETDARWRWAQGRVWILPVTAPLLQSWNEGQLPLPGAFDWDRGDKAVFLATAAPDTPLARGPLPPPAQGTTWLAPAVTTRLLSNATRGIDGVFKEKEPWFSSFHQQLPPEAPQPSSQEPRLFYVRTLGGAPQQELSRNPAWVHFWLALFTENKGEGKSKTHSIIDLNQKNTFPPSLSAPVFQLSQAPVAAPTAQNEAPQQSLRWTTTSAITGLNAYLMPSQGHLVSFFLPPDEESLEIWDTPLPAPQHHSQKAANKERDATKSTAESRGTLREGLFAMGALIACGFLWWPRSRSGAPSGPPRGLAILLLGILGGVLGKSEAQGAPLPTSSSLNNPPDRALAAVPFEIAWCEAVVPPPVADRYQALRKTLEDRGTIELPPRLIPGGCTPSGQKIWWSDSFESLPRSSELAIHLGLGGAFILEASTLTQAQSRIQESPALGRFWETPAHRSMLLRSFYLLQSFIKINTGGFYN